MHRRTSDLVRAWALEQLADAKTDVIYVHGHVPHVPLHDEQISGRERFVVTRERYVRQLELVDEFIASA